MNLEDLDKIDSKKMYRTYDNWPQIDKDSFNDDFEKFHPVAGNVLSYQDFKMLECRKIIEAIALNEEAYPNFRWGAEIQLLVDASIKSSKENKWIKVKDLL